MESLRLESVSPVVAPDGSRVLPLLSLDTGSVAHCSLGPGQTSQAVRHTVIQEIWYFVGGQGEMWRQDAAAGTETVEACGPGLCITIPEGVSFQFRNTGVGALEFLCVTMPPWPGEHVARVVEGKWQPQL